MIIADKWKAKGCLCYLTLQLLGFKQQASDSRLKLHCLWHTCLPVFIVCCKFLLIPINHHFIFREKFGIGCVGVIFLGIAIEAMLCLRRWVGKQI